MDFAIEKVYNIYVKAEICLLWHKFRRVRQGPSKRGAGIYRLQILGR